MDLTLHIIIEGEEYLADITNGQLVKYRGPDIKDINAFPDKCLYFVQSVVDEIKRQREMVKR